MVRKRKITLDLKTRGVLFQTALGFLAAFFFQNLAGKVMQDNPILGLFIYSLGALGAFRIGYLWFKDIFKRKITKSFFSSYLILSGMLSVALSVYMLFPYLEA